jgi:hypothetical protein
LLAGFAGLGGTADPIPWPPGPVPAAI